MYVTGIYALNIECKLNSTGDWHRSAIRWDVLPKRLKESDVSIFVDYGIEKNKTLNFLKGSPKYNVANHIRACLDLLVEGNFPTTQGMRDDFICTDEYDEEIFKKDCMLKELSNWKDIDDFMGKEYKIKWLNFKEKEGI